MKKLLLTLAALMLPLSLPGERPGKKVEFGDPFIMLHKGTYYAYGTSVGDGFEVFLSDDLLTWRRPDGDPYALRSKDAFGSRGFWAPEVYHVNGKFHMFYTADSRTSAAVSDSPLGPFRSDEPKAYLPGEKNIDNSLFIDRGGKPYLFLDRFNDGLNIWVADLSDDLTKIDTTTLTKCIAVSQSWEKVRGRVNEGCFVIRHRGKYYMTYSGYDFRSPNYGIGFATAGSVHGKWTKYAGNPICQNVGGLTGIGHSALFRDKKGKLRIVFHAHKDTTSVGPRAMYISTVSFKKVGGERIMVISPDYITPTLAD